MTFVASVDRGPGGAYYGPSAVTNRRLTRARTAASPAEGQWRNWQRTGLQNRRLRVRVPPALHLTAQEKDSRRARSRRRGDVPAPVPGAGDRQQTRDMADVSETTAAEGGSGRRSEGSGRSSEVEPRRGVFARIARFIRQVFAELRKVVRPTRRELITYFLVVVVFVLVMMAITGVLDLVFGQLALWTFG